MARRGVRIVFLCEDNEHKQFAYRAFLKLGFHRRELYVTASPVGRGAAEQWVREQYPIEVKSQRRRSSSQHAGLLVVLDADRCTVAERANQLADQLARSGQSQRAASERIVHWIPRRHIETWIASLRGRDVDEESDCKSLVKSDDIRPSAESFVRIYRDANSRPADALPSLSLALEETDRLRIKK